MIISLKNRYKNKWLIRVYWDIVGISCVAGNCTYILQKVLSSMVGHGTWSKTCNVWFVEILFISMHIKVGQCLSELVEVIRHYMFIAF